MWSRQRRENTEKDTEEQKGACPSHPLARGFVMPDKEHLSSNYTGCLSALQTVVTTYQGEKHPALGEGQSQCSFPEDTSLPPVPKRCQAKNGQGQPQQLPLRQAVTGSDRQPLVLLPLQPHMAQLLSFLHRLGAHTPRHKGVSGKFIHDLQGLENFPPRGTSAGKSSLFLRSFLLRSDL